MGRYINWADVGGKYTDITRTGGSQEVESPFIAASEDEIDAAMAGLYTVPFTPCPGMIKDLCIDLVYYKANFRQTWAKDFKGYIDARIKSLQDLKYTLTISGTLLTDNPPSAVIDPTRAFVPVGGQIATGSSRLYGDDPQNMNVWP